MSMFEMIKSGRISLDRVRQALKLESNKFSNDFVDMDTPHPNKNFVKAVRSKNFLIQIFKESPNVTRLSINRTSLNADGSRWKDGITWDEIQDIKNRVGFKDYCAVEVYPPEDHKVDVANIRHIWVLDTPPNFMWRAS